MHDDAMYARLPTRQVPERLLRGHLREAAPWVQPRRRCWGKSRPQSRPAAPATSRGVPWLTSCDFLRHSASATWQMSKKLKPAQPPSLAQPGSCALTDDQGCIRACRHIDSGANGSRFVGRVNLFQALVPSASHRCRITVTSAAPGTTRIRQSCAFSRPTWFGALHLRTIALEETICVDSAIRLLLRYTGQVKKGRRTKVMDPTHDKSTSFKLSQNRES